MTASSYPAGAALGSALRPAVRRLAIDALARGAGSTLPTNAEYLREHQVGAGTLQRALKVLEDCGALRTTSHGHQGRRIDSTDVGPAWLAGALPPVRLLIPPSGPDEIDALEDLLAQELTALGIPHTVHHLRGGGRRLDSVRAGLHDIALTSSGVRDQAEADGRLGPSALVRRLPAGTYYGAGRLAVVSRTGTTSTIPRRVAIDRESPDHVALTRAEFPESDELTHVEIPFTRVPAAVLRGDVDAGIWHIQVSVIPLDLVGLVTRPLRLPSAHEAWERISAAVLFGWSGRPELAGVIRALRLEDVGTAQARAIASRQDG